MYKCPSLQYLQVWPVVWCRCVNLQLQLDLPQHQHYLGRKSNCRKGNFFRVWLGRLARCNMVRSRRPICRHMYQIRRQYSKGFCYNCRYYNSNRRFGLSVWFRTDRQLCCGRTASHFKHISLFFIRERCKSRVEVAKIFLNRALPYETMATDVQPAIDYKAYFD